MVETDKHPDFSARLDAALAMNDLTNAEFASAINATSGQQSVNRWRSRGRIGQPSVAVVRRLLPRTSIDWIQEGIGPAERLSENENASRVHDFRGSRAARLDVHILAQALGVLEAVEFKIKPKKLRALDAAMRLRDYYERMTSGEVMADLIAQIFNEDDQESSHAQLGEDTGATTRR